MIISEAIKYNAFIDELIEDVRNILMDESYITDREYICHHSKISEDKKDETVVKQYHGVFESVYPDQAISFAMALLEEKQAVMYAIDNVMSRHKYSDEKIMDAEFEMSDLFLGLAKRHETELFADDLIETKKTLSYSRIVARECGKILLKRANDRLGSDSENIEVNFHPKYDIYGNVEDAFAIFSAIGAVDNAKNLD